MTTLSWQATNATSCTAGGGWSGGRAATGSEMVGPLTATTEYQLACTGEGGSANAAVSVAVNANGSAPTLTFTASPASVSSGGAATLTWSSTNATGCTASGAWAGAKATSGTQSTGVLTASSSYTLSCQGSGGTVTASATVTVNSGTPPPTVTLMASPSSVTPNSAATLTWSSSNATGCTASGAWSGAKALSGSQSTGALTATSTFTLACTGTGGTTSRSATVSVASTSPVTLSFRRVLVDSNSPPDPWMKNMADLNGDGLVDLIVAGASGPIVWYRAPGWTKATIASSADSQSGSAVGDIDGDGDIDIVVGTTWYENGGNGTSWTPHALGSGGTHDIIVADVNADGKQDVIMRGEGNSIVTVFLQVSKTSWNPFDLEPGLGRNGLEVADVDGDGRPDIVVGGVWMKNPGGDVRATPWPAFSFTSGWDPFAAVKVIDIDNDGRRDIVLSVSENVGKLSWFKAPANPQSGSWAETVVATNLDHVHGFAVADLDGDGALDIAASEYGGQGRLIIYLARGSSWDPHEVGRDKLHNMRAADVGSDGDLDFFGADAFGVHEVILYENTSTPTPTPGNRVLVFSKTLGFRHTSIPDGIAAIQQLGATNGFAVDASEDSGVFTAANLARYRAVVFLNPSGDILDAAQRTAFQQYIQSGGGFAGIHNATALVLEDWDWYTKLVGARYVSELSTQPSRLQVVDASHVSTTGLPNPWNVTVESYNFDVNPKVNGATVLLNLDESSVNGGSMGSDHPWSWYHAYDGGRSWYTTGGANTPDYQDANFLKHILGGIRYAGAF